jgi:hypothetical protein
LSEKLSARAVWAPQGRFRDLARGLRHRLILVNSRFSGPSSSANRTRPPGQSAKSSKAPSTWFTRPTSAAWAACVNRSSVSSVAARTIVGYPCWCPLQEVKVPQPAAFKARTAPATPRSRKSCSPNANSASVNCSSKSSESEASLMQSSISPFSIFVIAAALVQLERHRLRYSALNMPSNTPDAPAGSRSRTGSTSIRMSTSKRGRCATSIRRSSGWSRPKRQTSGRCCGTTPQGGGSPPLTPRHRWGPGALRPPCTETH